MRGLEVLREPALHGRLDDRLEAVLPHRLAQLVPHRGEVRHHARAAAARHQAIDAMRVLDRERLRDRTAEPEADQRGLLNLQCVEKRFKSSTKSAMV